MDIDTDKYSKRNKRHVHQPLEATILIYKLKNVDSSNTYHRKNWRSSRKWTSLKLNNYFLTNGFWQTSSRWSLPFWRSITLASQRISVASMRAFSIGPNLSERTTQPCQSMILNQSKDVIWSVGIKNKKDMSGADPHKLWPLISCSIEKQAKKKRKWYKIISGNNNSL